MRTGRKWQRRHGAQPAYLSPYRKNGTKPSGTISCITGAPRITLSTTRAVVNPMGNAQPDSTRPADLLTCIGRKAWTPDKLETPCCITKYTVTAPARLSVPPAGSCRIRWISVHPRKAWRLQARIAGRVRPSLPSLAYDSPQARYQWPWPR